MRRRPPTHRARAWPIGPLPFISTAFLKALFDKLWGPDLPKDRPDA